MIMEKLTSEQEELMVSVRNEWIDLFYNTKRINKQDFEEGINWIYNSYLKLPNPKIIYCESWLEALVTISVIQSNVLDNVGANVGANVRDNVGDNVMANVGANVRDNVWANVRDNVWDNVRDNVWDNVWDNVGANVRDNVRDNVWDNVRDNVGANVGDKFNNYSDYISTYSNFGWVSFYDYFEKIGILDNDDFKKYKKLIRAGSFQTYEYENYVFAIQPPKYIYLDEENRMNNITDKAFEWSDGYGFYYVNGMNLSEEIFLKLKENKYTFEDFIKEENEEIKSAVIGFIQQRDGDAGVYNFLKEYLKEVDVYIDKKSHEFLEGTTKGDNIGVYTLYKGEVNDTEIAYVNCYCPSTDRTFFLGVDPSNINAKDAIASLYQVPTILKDKITSISRQGEKFSTIFDKETTSKLLNNEYSKDELSEYTYISGEEYFKLMQYEF